MKKLLLIAIVACLSSCEQDSAIKDITNCKKPAIIFSKYKPVYWFDNPQMTVKDADGKLIKINGYLLDQFIDKYNVGDTLK